MSFRVATVNRWQDHKSWGERRELIVDQLEQLRADVLALNEVCIPLQSGRYLQQAAATRLGVGYNSIQQYKVNGSSGRPVDALRTPFYSSSHPRGSHVWGNQFIW